jgi:hypothetical protein
VQIVTLCDVDVGNTRYEDAWHRGLAPAKEEVEAEADDLVTPGR